MFTWTMTTLTKIHFPEEKYKRVKSIGCGQFHTAAILLVSLPLWNELKPLLVGWKKDTECCLYRIPMHILQLIVEMAWDCELPKALSVP